MVDKDELEARLKAKTPKGWYGMAVGPGWYDIVDEADKAITALSPGYSVLQIKEKFGGLRYYITGSDPEHHDEIKTIIRRAEKKAAVTCEECGKPGTLRSEGWYRTQCDEHDAEYLARKAEQEARYT